MKKLKVLFNKNLGKEASLEDKIGTIVGCVSFILLMWGALSWAEIVLHNAPHQAPYTYSDWNLLVMLFGGK